MKRATNRQNSLPILDWQIAQLPGLSADDVAKLADRGIATTLNLLRKAGNPTQREALALDLAISIQRVNKWVIMADLACIPAVGCQYCGLLLHAGICSTAQLAKTSLHPLQSQIKRLHVKLLYRADLCPTIEQLSLWIRQAQQLVLERSARKSVSLVDQTAAD